MLSEAKNKRNNESGAVLVMAIFVALFLVAVVYHVIGVGAAALEQQVVQDAADTVAFSNAAAKARGMNIIALLNILMAAILSVFVAVRLLLAVLVVATAAATVACIFAPPACSVVPMLTKVTVRVNKIANNMKPKIKKALKGLAKAEDAVNKGVPVLAQAEAIYVSTRSQYKPAQLGFAWPIIDELPTKKGDFKTLCRHAGEYVGDAALCIVPMPDKAKDVISEIMGGMVSQFSDYFCGDGGGGKPETDLSKPQKVAYPAYSHKELCSVETSQPSEALKDCPASTSNPNACQKCAQLGCTECSKYIDKTSGQPRYIDGLWSTVVSERVRVKNPDGSFFVKILSTGVKDLVWLDDDPCADAGKNCGGESVCVIEERSPAGVGYGPDDELIVITDYKNFHGCRVKQKLQDTEVDLEPEDPSDWPVHREFDSDELEEGVRVRGFVFGKTKSNQRLKNVSVAGGKVDNALINGRFAFAAADFRSPKMSLWEMKWQSRLIRFRKSSKQEGGYKDNCKGNFFSDCAKVGEKADSVMGGLSFKNLVLH